MENGCYRAYRSADHCSGLAFLLRHRRCFLPCSADFPRACHVKAVETHESSPVDPLNHNLYQQEAIGPQQRRLTNCMWLAYSLFSILKASIQYSLLTQQTQRRNSIATRVSYRWVDASSAACGCVAFRCSRSLLIVLVRDDMQLPEQSLWLQPLHPTTVGSGHSEAGVLGSGNSTSGWFSDTGVVKGLSVLLELDEPGGGGVFERGRENPVIGGTSTATSRYQTSCFSNLRHAVSLKGVIKCWVSAHRVDWRWSCKIEPWTVLHTSRHASGHSSLKSMSIAEVFGATAFISLV
ncbi:hypothetical protein KCV06_g49, partial [Aureobasidium melanogenum]